MIQVKYNDQKWCVLHQGVWIEASEKDWDEIARWAHSVDEWDLLYHEWLPTPDQIYSLPDEVEFEIKSEVESCMCVDYCPHGMSHDNCKTTKRTKQVAHLKDSEPKKEEPHPFDGSCELPTLDEAIQELANKIERR